MHPLPWGGTWGLEIGTWSSPWGGLWVEGTSMGKRRINSLPDLQEELGKVGFGILCCCCLPQPYKSRMATALFIFEQPLEWDFSSFLQELWSPALQVSGTFPVVPLRPLWCYSILRNQRTSSAGGSWEVLN